MLNWFPILTASHIKRTKVDLAIPSDSFRLIHDFKKYVLYAWRIIYTFYWNITNQTQFFSLRPPKSTTTTPHAQFTVQFTLNLHNTVSALWLFILAYVIVCIRHNSCLRFVGKCCKTCYILSLLVSE